MIVEIKYVVKENPRIDTISMSLKDISKLIEIK